VSYEIPYSDLDLILKTLKESTDPDVIRARNQIEAQSLIEDLKKYDPPAEFRLHIAKITHYLKHWFSLDDWAGYIQFEALQETGDPHTETRVTIRTDRVYLNYTLRIGIPILENWRRGEWFTIGHSLCHEFCHILTDPIIALALSDAAPSQVPMMQEINERQVQRFAVIITEALPDNWYTPEKLTDWFQRHPEIELPKAEATPAAA
jgi:hypothetical protein